MTQLIDADQLQHLSAPCPPPALPMDRLVPVLRWTIDQATGRPVGNWELAARQPAPSPRTEA
jgi:hypothetical protein